MVKQNNDSKQFRRKGGGRGEKTTMKKNLCAHLSFSLLAGLFCLFCRAEAVGDQVQQQQRASHEQTKSACTKRRGIALNKTLPVSDKED